MLKFFYVNYDVKFEKNGAWNRLCQKWVMSEEAPKEETLRFEDYPSLNNYIHGAGLENVYQERSFINRTPRLTFRIGFLEYSVFEKRLFKPVEIKISTKEFHPSMNWIFENLSYEEAFRFLEERKVLNAKILLDIYKKL